MYTRTMLGVSVAPRSQTAREIVSRDSTVPGWRMRNASSSNSRWVSAISVWPQRTVRAIRSIVSRPTSSRVSAPPRCARRRSARTRAVSSSGSNGFAR